MTKRGRAYTSQTAEDEASKRRWTAFDQAIDDLIPIALAQQLRQRLPEHIPESSTARVEGPKKNARGRKVDHLYFRQTPTEFISLIQNLTPRQKEAVNELGFGPVLDFKIWLEKWVEEYGLK